MKSKLKVGLNPLQYLDKKVEGAYVQIAGEQYYKIENCDAMPPFFMTIVSAYDHWMFVSSNGGITAGRKNPDSALFPYYTDDKIIETAEYTGSKSILRILKGSEHFLWEPFSERYEGIYHIEQNIYKNKEGNKIVFEEQNRDLDLTFSVLLSACDRFGFVRKTTIANGGVDAIEIDIVDGVMNVLPYGVNTGLQTARSTLVDAYKKNELNEKTGMGIYTLSSMIVDRAEPSEALRATIVWCAGLNPEHILLCSNQLKDYRAGKELKTEKEVKAEKGAYLVNTSMRMDGKSAKSWYVLADLNLSVASVNQLLFELEKGGDIVEQIEHELIAATEALRFKVAMADGLQLSNDRLSTGRHFSNVLFNIMRGGTFEDAYQISTDDLSEFVQTINKNLLKRNRSFFSGLPQRINRNELLAKASASGDMDLERLCMEYLPLSFSRRHGDPSRPWNYFTIETRHESGMSKKNYEGNWRDIFQNWEALAHSYPEFIESMITKFVNSSTIDGYNPYRVNRDGIDWEVHEPNDPWSYIGYWGDHQIIYLLKLMELSAAHHPAKLKDLLVKDLNVYANVPYKIRGYDAILMNARETVDYDHHLEQIINQRVEEIGTDGKMVFDTQGDLVRANLSEKILVTSLTKLYNFIPEAGIWLNTQRPEWNDANNALVGNGTSMVTLYYLRRFLKFSIELFADLEVAEIELNKPVHDLMDALNRAMRVRVHLLNGKVTDEERRIIMDRFGIAGEHYRTSAYSGFLGHKQRVKPSEIQAFFELSLQFIEHSILANKRPDGLYHSYNLINISENCASIGHLYEMLEGQVAVLSSKILNAEQSLEVLHALKSSAMFRPDQYSYMLYPDRDLASFLNKNTIPKSKVEHSELANCLIKDGNTSLVERDVNGEYHFNGSFHNASDVKNAFDLLESGEYSALAKKERAYFLQLFEEVFNHVAFTGRSGTFFGYEGLGCIYWHMVSKLLLSTQENIIWAMEQGADPSVIGSLIDHYYEIRAGIGINKSPEVYGAFPTDAYSHTPKNAGAQQPGMTGQVKEDIINRWAELGVRVQHGRVSFFPRILRAEELLIDEADFQYYDQKGTLQSLQIQSGKMAFTYCQVPIIYGMGESNHIVVTMKSGETITLQGTELTPELSDSIFLRNDHIKRIDCSLAKST